MAVHCAPNILTILGTEIDAFDRSMWYVSLTPAQTLDLAGSNIQVQLDIDGGGTTIHSSVIRQGLLRVNLSGDC